MPLEFDQEKFDAQATMLAETMRGLQAQMQAFRLGANWTPFRVIIPTQNLPTTITPEASILLKGVLALTSNPTTFTISDDAGMGVTINVAANTPPTPLWDLYIERALIVTAASNPALLWGVIRR